jgi:hypothetical protein
MKTLLNYNGIEVKSTRTRLETLLILDDYAEQISKMQNDLLSFFKDKGYSNEDVAITIEVGFYLTVIALSSSGDIESRSSTYTFRYTDSSYSKVRNEKGLAAKAEAEEAKMQKKAEEDAKIEAETLRIKQEELKKEEEAAILLCRKKTWIEQHGSEELKLLLEFGKNFNSTLEAEFIQALNIPNFYEISEIDRCNRTYTPTFDLLLLAKKLKQAGYTVTDFSKKSVEIKVEVFGKGVYVLCRP